MSSSTTTATMASLLKIGIIGLGPFAQFIAKTMIRQGHTLTATSRSDYSDLCSNLNITFYKDIEAFIDAGNDIILICTSINSLSKVVNSIPFHLFTTKNPTTPPPPPPLFVDVLSVKEHPKQLLLQELPEEMDLLCTHPMFGPESGKNGWKDLPFVYDKVRIRNEDICSRFLHIFQNEGCRMEEMSCEEHDRLAARSQFLTHTVGRMLSEMEIESTSMDTKGFQTLLQLKENTMKDSLELYCGLFMHNQFAKQELKNLELALQMVKQKLLEKTDDILLDSTDF